LEDLYLEEIRSGLLKYLWIFTHISTCRLIYHNIPHMEHMGSFSYGQSCSFGAIIHTQVMFHGDVELRHGIEGKKYKNKQYLEDMSLRKAMCHHCFMQMFPSNNPLTSWLTFKFVQSYSQK
jgi:hypothetical protein